MKAFFKTLFGDLHNLGFVAAVVAVAALMIHLGAADAAPYTTPAIILAGTAWFAKR